MSDILGWHFAHVDGTPAHGRLPEPVATGAVFEVAPPLIMCKRGLHASVMAIDALKYAQGPLVSRVRCSGEILEQDDKLCCSSREHLWVVDATRTLHEFALEVAEGALTREREAGREPDERLWAALEVKRRWLAGAATEEALAAAWAAARDARDAASAAASAARDAASAAAWWAAARAAAWDAARDAQNARLEGMLMALEPQEVRR